MVEKYAIDTPQPPAVLQECPSSITSRVCLDEGPNLQELRQEVLNIVSHMKPEQFVHIFDDWVKQHKKCVELNGDYVEKS